MTCCEKCEMPDFPGCAVAEEGCCHKATTGDSLHALLEKDYPIGFFWRKSFGDSQGGEITVGHLEGKYQKALKIGLEVLKRQAVAADLRRQADRVEASIAEAIGNLEETAG